MAAPHRWTEEDEARYRALKGELRRLRRLARKHDEIWPELDAKSRDFVRLEARRPAVRLAVRPAVRLGDVAAMPRADAPPPATTSRLDVPEAPAAVRERRARREYRVFGWVFGGWLAVGLAAVYVLFDVLRLHKAAGPVVGAAAIIALIALWCVLLGPVVGRISRNLLRYFSD